MAENNLELPPGYTIHPDEHLEMPSGYSLAAPIKHAQGFVQGLVTNDATQGVGAFVGRNLPRAIGGGFGATTGAGVASIPGAALGGAAGEAARQALVSITGNQSADLGTAAKSVGGNVGGAALEQGAGQGVVLGAGAAINAVAPKIMEAFARVPTKYGAAALKGASTGEGALSTALPQEEVSAAYQAFEANNGLTGMVADTVQNGGVPPSVATKMQHIFDVGQRIVNKQPVDPQELYLASQYASNLKLMSRFGQPPPETVGFAAAIDQGKQLADDALAAVYPEYTALRTNQFLTKAKDALSSALPLNRNMSADKLGLKMALGAAGTAAGVGEMTGHRNAGLEVAAVPLLAMSPMAYGAAIRSAPLLAGAARTGAAQAGMTLMDYWQQLQSQHQNATQQPRNPAPPLAPR